MTHTLVFKKKGVEILSLGTSHPMAVAFLDKPYGKFEAMPQTAFVDALHTLVLQDESFEDDTEMLDKMLEHSTDWKEKWEIITRLSDIKKERKALADAKIMINMLSMIWEEGTDDESSVGLEWAVV